MVYAFKVEAGRRRGLLEGGQEPDWSSSIYKSVQASLNGTTGSGPRPFSGTVLPGREQLAELTGRNIADDASYDAVLREPLTQGKGLYVHTQ
ncbi:MAG: hypothetical protein KF760_33220 [Candidatus Eremiobacteraeota bacterium]|nr:hypothetical protein [Candidatus Eremiobacteraeota bacterium]MCW5869067.1 hypothetical protein [Candidatus Eremiobacteraeota bacterium]